MKEKIILLANIATSTKVTMQVLYIDEIFSILL
jgi:hypothetical protein